MARAWAGARPASNGHPPRLIGRRSRRLSDVAGALERAGPRSSVQVPSTLRGSVAIVAAFRHFGRYTSLVGFFRYCQPFTVS